MELIIIQRTETAKGCHVVARTFTVDEEYNKVVDSPGIQVSIQGLNLEQMAEFPMNKIITIS